MDDGSLLRGPNDQTATGQTTSEAKNSSEVSDGSNRKRSKSGGILGGFPFMRTTKSTIVESKGGESARTSSSMATALHHGRQRQGSLRKTAMAKVRERSGSLLKERNSIKSPAIITTMHADVPTGYTDVTRFSYAHDALSPPADDGRLPSEDDLELPRRERSQLIAPPITSPIAPYTSTTDEDDTIPFYRASASSSVSSFNTPPQGPARRRSNRSERRASVTIAQVPSDIEMEDEWDYSETEWWGWVVLIVTWLVFVVVMGSCLGVWSWAWDVGETPYAPPELEDDATLPITGYYPALMVCTAIMAWVWVVVAWVGMKYFRHAKVSVDG
jgi:hypothetical protein